MVSNDLYDHGRLQPLFSLLLSLISGAVIGVFSATLFCSGADGFNAASAFSEFQSVGFLRRVLLSLLFPALLFGASLTGEASVIALLFFGKGFFFSFILCICVNCGFFPERASVYRMLFFRNIFPLPVYYYAASKLICYNDLVLSRIRFRLLFLVFLTAFVCSGVEAVFTAII